MEGGREERDGTSEGGRESTHGLAHELFKSRRQKRERQWEKGSYGERERRKEREREKKKKGRKQHVRLINHASKYR